MLRPREWLEVSAALPELGVPSPHKQVDGGVLSEGLALLV